MYVGWLILVLALPAFVIVGWIWVRRERYRRQLNYSPRADYDYAFEKKQVRLLPLVWDSEGFTVAGVEGVATAFVKVRITTSAFGALADPYVEIERGEESTRQYFERRTSGIRYLNLSRLVACGTGEVRIRLRGKRCRWVPVDATLYAFEQSLKPDERVVVVAPHPDDAEIAAFGVYSTTDSVVVTVTAGNASDRYRSLQPLTADDIARVRVWDSITIPQIGGVSPQRAINLAYPDGQLPELAKKPDRDCRGELKFDELRNLNLSDFVRDKAICSWNSLVEDLALIFTRHRPTVIVTPSPTYDSHPDHCYTTLAVCEAIKRAGLSEGRLFLCVIHNHMTELHPFGPATSTTSLHPNLDASRDDWNAICSYAVSSKQQVLKYLALEAMHDVRDIPPLVTTEKMRFRNFLGELKALMHGMGNPPTSLLRRAARPDEVFFVVDYHRALELLPSWRADQEVAK